MSNADQEEKIMAARIDAIADAAWKEWAQTHALDNNIPQTCFRSGFAIGYTRCRDDAWDLPEVGAEELKIGKWYIASGLVAEGPIPVWCASEIRNDRERIGSWFQCFGDEHSTLAVKNVSFRGPLPLGGE